MQIKDSKQASVRIGFDGRVHKHYRGPMAKERFENELKVLQYLEEKGCDFVPKVLETKPEDLYVVTTNCGQIVEKISDQKAQTLFDDLVHTYGVQHGDPFQRNVTYSGHLGRFCVIDFEFATILETGEGLTLEEVENSRREEKRKENERL